MASNYTASYGLCQWESGDQFIRSEFNQDNQKIDTALKRVADTAAADLQAVRVQLQSAAQTAQSTAEQALDALVPVAAGDSVHFTCSSLGTHYKMPIVRDSNQRIYAGYVFQGTNATTGTVRTKGVSLPSASGVRAWVRHTGGSVALTFYNGGNIRKMTHVGTRSTVDSNGNACTEEEFQLTSDQIAAADSLLFTLSLGSNERVELLDYGVVLL